MTATMHIGRRTTPLHPLTTLRGRWNAFRLRHFARVQDAYFQALHDALPLDDPDRHALDAAALEARFASLAIDHPEAVVPAGDDELARSIDREQLLLATCDAWFREVHGPEHRWSPRLVARYERLMVSISACFHPGGPS